LPSTTRDATFATLVQRKAEALLVTSDALFGSNRRRLIELAAGHRIPTSYFDSDFVREGGLMSYGASREGVYRQVGNYVVYAISAAICAASSIWAPLS
jgi:putative ABC transport system substrate-binding protein